MTPDEATTDVCLEQSWIGHLKVSQRTALLDHPDWHVLFAHYMISLYWTIVVIFNLGAPDISTTLPRNSEVAFVTLVELISWIFVLVLISGTLTSLFIESDVEKENFLTRLFSIRLILKFTKVSKEVQDEVYKFYNYLWTKSKGIVRVDLVDVLPPAMKAEVFYDVNKFVMDQVIRISEKYYFSFRETKCRLNYKIFFQ